jgi:hypothetical protein
MTHHCHAPGCKRPCPPRWLMCRECWATVPDAMQREVCRTVKLRGPYCDASWAPWWRAQAHANHAAAVARERSAGRPRDPRGDRWLARELAFADELDRKEKP